MISCMVIDPLYSLNACEVLNFDLPFSDVLNGIGNDWSSTDDRLGSDVRFYCNNGKSFETRYPSPH